MFIVGAGGGGGLPAASTSYGSYTAGYAGEGGAVVYQENMPFIKGEEINVVIGQGGSAATTANNAGNKGGDTSLELSLHWVVMVELPEQIHRHQSGVMEQLVHLEI